MNKQRFDHPSFKVLVTGVSGTGKTTLWETILRRERARLKFVFDHQGEFARRFGVPAVFDAAGLCDAVARGGWVVYDPIREFAGRSQAAFAFFCDFVMTVCAEIGGRKILACDELQKIINARVEPAELLAVLDTGRRYQIDFLGISQAPNRIHNGVRNQLTAVYTFRQSEKNAVAYLSDNGFPAKAVRSLPRFAWLYKNFDTGETDSCGAEFPSDAEGDGGSMPADQRGDSEGGCVASGDKSADSQVSSGKPAAKNGGG